MKKLLLTLIALCATLPSFGWGQKGHDTVARIAEENVSRKVLRKAVEVLGGHSLVYYSNWMDNASHTQEYRYTKTWHYANVDEGYTYATMTKNQRGDVVTAINDIVARLKSGKLTPEEERVNLRFLVHLVGDIHAPMHAGRLSDLGGNKVFVKFFDEKMKLHELWDEYLIEAVHKWSHTEWSHQLNDYCSPERKVEIAKGTPEQWLIESHEVAKGIYIASPQGKNLSYYYVNYYAPIIEERLLAGGLRLARLLTEIYGK